MFFLKAGTNSQTSDRVRQVHPVDLRGERDSRAADRPQEHLLGHRSGPDLPVRGPSSPEMEQTELWGGLPRQGLHQEVLLHQGRRHGEAHHRL